MGWCNSLTHLCQMYFPIPINWTSPFLILGLLGGFFHIYSNFKSNFWQQTVENLIGRRILQRLIWFCTVCQCSTKRTLGLYGLILCVHSHYWTCLTLLRTFRPVVICSQICIASNMDPDQTAPKGSSLTRFILFASKVKVLEYIWIYAADVISRNQFPATNCFGSIRPKYDMIKQNLKGNWGKHTNYPLSN